MTTRHTAGPWIALGGQVRTAQDPNWLIAAMGHTFRYVENAQLIAAAPELLAALEDMVDGYEDLFGDALNDLEEKETFAEYWKAKDAIAKAKGD